MTLTAAQLSTLAADIAANAAVVNGVAMSALPHTPDNAFAVAAWYSAPAAPAFTVWKTDLTKDDIDKAVDWAEVVALTTNNLLAFQVLKDQGRVDGSSASIRNAFGQIFPVATRPNSNAGLLAAAKRAASNVEKLFATGAGTTASPATMGYEGRLSDADVRAAWGI